MLKVYKILFCMLTLRHLLRELTPMEKGFLETKFTLERKLSGKFATSIWTPLVKLFILRNKLHSPNLFRKLRNGNTKLKSNLNNYTTSNRHKSFY